MGSPGRGGGGSQTRATAVELVMDTCGRPLPAGPLFCVFVLKLFVNGADTLFPGPPLPLTLHPAPRAGLGRMPSPLNIFFFTSLDLWVTPDVADCSPLLHSHSSPSQPHRAALSRRSVPWGILLYHPVAVLAPTGSALAPSHPSSCWTPSQAVTPASVAAANTTWTLVTLLGVPHVHPAPRPHLRLEAGGSSRRPKQTLGHSQLPCLVLRGPRGAESGSQAGGQGPPTAANVHHPELRCRQTPCRHPQLRRPRNLIGLLSVSHKFSIKTQCSSTDRLPLGVFPSLPLVKHHLERKERVRRASPTSQHRPARSRFPGKQVLEGEPHTKRGTEHSLPQRSLRFQVLKVPPVGGRTVFLLPRQACLTHHHVLKVHLRWTVCQNGRPIKG